jgi:hypothetical protein
VRSNTVAETYIGAGGGLVNVPPTGGDKSDGESAGGCGGESQARNSLSAGTRVDPHAAVGRQKNVGCLRISDHCRERTESRPRVGRDVPLDGRLPSPGGGRGWRIDCGGGRGWRFGFGGTGGGMAALGAGLAPSRILRHERLHGGSLPHQRRERGRWAHPRGIRTLVTRVRRSHRTSTHPCCARVLVTRGRRLTVNAVWASAKLHRPKQRWAGLRWAGLRWAGLRRAELRRGDFYSEQLSILRRSL